eukprot:11272870-Karenia_brevis.AAC.1
MGALTTFTASDLAALLQEERIKREGEEAMAQQTASSLADAAEASREDQQLVKQAREAVNRWRLAAERVQEMSDDNFVRRFLLEHVRGKGFAS